MLVTEEEARKLWCPYARGYRKGAASNRDLTRLPDVSGGVMTSCRCIASQCMVWRWVRRDIARDHKPGHGYCGLAGRPES